MQFCDAHLWLLREEIACPICEANEAHDEGCNEPDCRAEARRRGLTPEDRP